MKDAKSNNTIPYTATILVFLLISHVLIEQEFFVKMLLDIADLEFWKLYFDQILYTSFAVIFIVIRRVFANHYPQLKSIINYGVYYDDEKLFLCSHIWE